MRQGAATTVPAKGSGPAWLDWLEGLYQRADALDAAGFAARLGEGGSLTFGNAETLTGPVAIEASLRDFFTAVTSMDHDVLRVYAADSSTAFEAVVSYRRPDGQVVRIPAVTAYTRDDEGNLHGRIYCDMAPVFAPA